MVVTGGSCSGGGIFPAALFSDVIHGLVKQSAFGIIMRLFKLLFLSVLMCGCSKVSSGGKAATELEEGKTLPEIALRGYGKVSGVLREMRGKNASFLEIACEDESKAKLTHAKYLSDLTSLPGVQSRSIQTKQGMLNVWDAEGQGMIAAIRVGNKVFVVAASGEAGLADALEACKVNLAQGSSKAETEVPMWLDRWDQFGFRFYYRPWEVPPGTKTPSDYDVVKEFEFAEKNDRSGFVFWADQNAIDMAEGMTNEVWWDWAFRETVARKLPVGLNITCGSFGEGWYYNRYRDQLTSKMPQYCGNYYRTADPYFGGTGILSWSATTARDAELGGLQNTVRRAVQHANVTTILEPHGELRHGAQDILMEYGPVADIGYRKFLQSRYPSINALNAAWGGQCSSWNEVRVPEVASFLGWGAQALDLSGTWRIAHEKLPAGAKPTGESREIISSEEAPDEWFSEKFDDSTWPTVTAPGHDRTMFLPKRPAVYRRTFDVADNWLATRPRVWLYLWDLNEATGDKVKVSLNGQLMGQSTLQHAIPHWGAVEVTKALHAGRNQLSLRLPKGFLAYRVYLSSDEPRQYPNLGKEGNARWVDFADWVVDSRLDAVQHGMEMIRQVEPNRQIVLMAPEGYVDGVKRLAVSYGGNFHNTGYMGGFWADGLPAVMRGARMPFCLEPGGPDHDLAGFKKTIGLYSTEGIQGIDYFIHIGDVMWNADMRQYFEDNLSLLKLIGKYHAPTAEVAALYSTRGESLTGYPWGVDYNTNLGAGYWAWNVRANLMGLYESDGLTESSFADGDATRYRVVIDTNTSILEAKMLSDIEKYIRDGGTFVTFVQTGRHTPVERDSWPIARLTGFRVTHIDKLNADGNPAEKRTLKPAPGQEILSGDWSRVQANGLTLEATASDATPLMLWEDGSVAIGLRKIGKGYIVQVGCKFTGRGIADRIEPSNNGNRPTFDSRSDESKELTRLLCQLLEWKKIHRVEGGFTPENQNVMQRHYLTNNGLYHVWTLWNQSQTAKVEGDLTLGDTAKVEWAQDVASKKKISVADQKIVTALEPGQTRVFLTPRHAITMAPLAWFELQREWWRESKPVSGVPLPPPAHRFSVDLGNDWTFKPLDANEDGAALAMTEVDDSGWEKVNMGIWSLPNHKNVKQAVLRKTFIVPERWADGDVTISLESWMSSTFVDQGRIWLDGKLISDWSQSGIINVNPDGVLKPGSKHILAVEIKGMGSLVGARGTAWLWVWPKPESTLDLAGDWASSLDVLHYDKTTRLPGSYKAFSLRSEVVIPADKIGKNVVLNVDTTGALTGVLVNGVWVRRFHHIIGTRFDLNITQWVKFGEKNEIELVSMGGPTDGILRRVNLGFHRPDAYP